MKAAIPDNEAERLAALCRYDILDTDHDPAFDEVVALASSICQTPIAVVNLIAEGRQWFKAEVGLGVRETPLEPSICAHAILQEDFFVVEDTTADPRFADNPLVTGDPYLRFYSGTLLTSSDGFPLGTLCVLDTTPRHLSIAQVETLKALGKHVMGLMELHVSMRHQQRLQKELEKALESHQRLLGIVSHDLRAPLNVVSLCAQQLALPGQSPDRATIISQRLNRATQSMTGLINDLLDFESIRKGELSLCIAPTPVRDLLSTVVQQYAPTARAARIELTLETPDELPVVQCDSARVEQILANLIQNAIKFTPEGGRIRLSAQELNASQVQFVVSDTGCGIEESDLRHVFRPHWRGTRNPGAGLGLSIVKALVDRQGGEIELRSSTGEGTTVSFQLPVCSNGRRLAG